MRQPAEARFARRIPKDKEGCSEAGEGKLPEGDQIFFERAFEKDTAREYRIPIS